ncbi:MAG: hypothetical protein IJB56_07000 [Alistipes sp.]|nr:hypothetical protein [Alistipes sp.]
MAKSKSFFGLRRGSTKTLTFQVNNGKQITKDRVYDVKNPRTQEQMVQRMVMATASAAYAVMKQIVDHSFQGITYGQMNMAEFIRLNAKKLRENLGAADPVMCYNKYQDRNIAPGEYIMSAGSASDFKTLPEVAAAEVTTGDAIQIALTLTSGTALNGDNLAAKYGFKIGDLMTVCYLRYNSSAEKWVFGFARFTVLKLGTTTITSSNLAEYIKIESSDTINISVGGNSISLETPEQDTDSAGVAYCVIHSEKTADGWNRNNTVLDITSVAENFMQYSESDAIFTYPVGGSYVLNGGEVNG